MAKVVRPDSKNSITQKMCIIFILQHAAACHVHLVNKIIDFNNLINQAINFNAYCVYFLM